MLTGNMISDFVKGKKKFNYTEGVQRGISLHRAIDEYTDRHSLTLEAKKLFKPSYGLYAGAFMDIVYDHFLANDRNEFTDDEALLQFSREVYQQLSTHSDSFPEKFQQVFFYMREQNWLYHYQWKQAIFNSFKGLVRRAKFIQDAQPACQVLEDHYEELSVFYAGFFPDLKKFAFAKWKELTSPELLN